MIEYAPMAGLPPVRVKAGPASLGLEKDTWSYVGHLVAIFREVRRVLRDDGTLWLNLGDSYAGNGDKSLGRNDAGRNLTGGGGNKNGSGNPGKQGTIEALTGIPPKNLVGIPWRVAFALQADGWILRRDVIWAKGISGVVSVESGWSGNVMPESVTDRPTTAHEYVFILAKAGRYFWDKEAVKEPVQDWGQRDRKPGSAFVDATPGRSKQSGGHNCDFAETGRNIRSVWTVSPSAYQEAHFATWPADLVEIMIKAGTSEHGVCPTCGAPWRRVVEKQPGEPASYKNSSFANGKTAGHQLDRASQNERMTTVDTGQWQPGCACAAGAGLGRDDLDIINSPTGSRAGLDPTMTTGRRGYNRPRGNDEGQRPITRYEQRHYAAQLKTSPHRKAMETEAGSAFAHYMRTDVTGARPIPGDILARWIANCWLEPVEPLVCTNIDPIPATVLDIFNGSGTTGMVANRLGRRYVGIDLNPEYCRLAVERIRGDREAAIVTNRALVTKGGAQLNLFGEVK